MDLSGNRITVMLANHAEVTPNGLLSCLSAGIGITGPGPTAYSLCGFVEINPANLRARDQHTIAFHLVDADGHLWLNEQGQPLMLELNFTGASASPEVAPGTIVTIPFALSLNGLQLPAGRYEWVAHLNGDTEPGWSASFMVRAPQPVE